MSELHRAQVGAVEGPDPGAALAVAEAVATVLLLTGDTAAAALFDSVWPEDSASSQGVHQATGMVLAQLDVSAGEAYVRLRAHAFAYDRTLAEVARAVVERTLRLDDHSPRRTDTQRTDGDAR